MQPLLNKGARAVTWVLQIQGQAAWVWKLVPMSLIELWGFKTTEPQGGRGRLELRNKQMNSTAPKILELLNREFEYHCSDSHALFRWWRHSWWVHVGTVQVLQWSCRDLGPSLSDPYATINFVTSGTVVSPQRQFWMPCIEGMKQTGVYWARTAEVAF